MQDGSHFINIHSTNYALTSTTEKIRKAVGDNALDCGPFIDFQRDFITIKHKNFLNLNILNGVITKVLYLTSSNEIWLTEWKKHLLKK